ncbi:MAG: 23S rRNA (guanosine(2251)-2'-O)-methyltransferase RlmB [Anaerolineae bacterium]|nr:23S rRNA (guanosine(2251)-2'-O)-methyltransferase RlmB [Anaerolineae bacterium]
METLFRRNAVLEALRSERRQVIHLWVQRGLPRKEIAPILQAARQRNIPVTESDKGTIGRKAGDSSHQGVALEVGPYPYATLDDIIARAEASGEPAFILLLDLVQGPQNVGQLLRTAEICGVHGVVVQERRAPDITPHIVAAAVGATEHLLIAQVTNLNSAIDTLKQAGVWIVGLDIDPTAHKFGQIDLNMPLGVVVGHEGSGMRRRVKESCDLLLRLPMRGKVDSLNASVAGSIVLYAAWQARGFGE